MDSVILGLSGGIDSSVVLKLLLQASELPNSPLKKIVGIFMPIHCDGITGQDTAEKYVNTLIQSYSFYQTNFVFDYQKCDLSDIVNNYYRTMQFEQSDLWVKGQIASITRTPVVYGYAAFLQSIGYRSIVVGTTNRDEGSYIGFYGKASDGMVDLQPIADLHKSEVIELAHFLQVPSEIIERVPTGDVWDASSDEQTFGAPYWFLEIYQILKSDNNLQLLSNLDDTNAKKEVIQQWCKNIENIHTKNQHKYQVGNPSHYIDVMPRKV